MKNFSFLCIIILSVCSLGMTGTVKTQQDTVIVPNVEGITMEVAAKVLQKVGLHPQIQSSSEMSAIVVRQAPRPGVQLPVGGEVILSSDVTVKMPQDVLGTRTRQPSSSVPSRSGISVEGDSASNVAGTPVTNTGTNVYVTSLQTTQQGKQVVLQKGQSKILYQPPQPRISQYFVADTKPRFYPAWYPKRFLIPVSPQDSASKPQPESGKTAIQGQVPSEIPVSSYSVPSDTKSQVQPVQYPKVIPPRNGSQYSIFVSQLDKPQRAGVFETSSTPAVPVPNLSRLRREDAISAIKKAGLSVGKIIRVQSSQLRSGIIVNQSPRARALVLAGTEVDLWITE